MTATLGERAAAFACMCSFKLGRSGDQDVERRLADALAPILAHEGARARAAAEAARAEEREACALLAERIGRKPKRRDGGPADWIRIAAAIRARRAPCIRGAPRRTITV